MVRFFDGDAFKELSIKLVDHSTSCYHVVFLQEEEFERLENPERHVIYIIQDMEYTVFLCPCGCSAKIHLNMMPEERPCWHLIDEGNGFSFEPSIRRTKGCKSHFWIFKNWVIHAPMPTTRRKRARRDKTDSR